MSSLRNYVDFGAHGQTSSIDTASNLRLRRSLIGGGSSNIYRSSYSSSGINYGTRARNNGNIYCTTKNGHYIGDKITNTHWERNRGFRKIQTVTSTRNNIRTGNYSNSIYTGIPYPKQYRYSSSSPQVIDKSYSTSSIPIKAPSSLSSSNSSADPGTPNSDVNSTANAETGTPVDRNRDSGLESIASSSQPDTLGKMMDFSQEKENDPAHDQQPIDFSINIAASGDVAKYVIHGDTSSTSEVSLQCSYVKTKSVESLSEPSSESITKSDIMDDMKKHNGEQKSEFDKNNGISISSENKILTSNSHSSLNAEALQSCSRASANSNKSSTCESTSDLSKSTRSCSRGILESVDVERSKTSFSNYDDSSNQIIAASEMLYLEIESLKMQAPDEDEAQNADSRSDRSFCSSSLSQQQQQQQQQSFDSNSKSYVPSRHKSDAGVSSGCNNSAGSNRKLVAPSSSRSAPELTAIKIKSAATTTIASASNSSSSSSSSRRRSSHSSSDSGSTSKSSSSSSSSCSNRSVSNISSDSNNSIGSQSARDASKSSNGQREIAAVVSPVSLSESVSSDVRNKKPPIPKSEMMRKKMSSPNTKYVNKDFRKSALNMENGDASRSQITKKKCRQKPSKNPSLASQDSQVNTSTNASSPNNCQYTTGSLTQSLSSDASSSNSSNENEEQNLSQRTNELSALTSDAKQLVSSADERSINANSRPRTLSSSNSKAENFNEKLASPVNSPLATASYPSKKSWCTAAYLDESSNSKNGSQCANLNGSLPKNKNFGQTRHQFSDEAPWWLDPNSDNVPEGVERHLSAASDDISQDTTISTVLPDDGKFKFKIWRQGSEERCWWLDDNENDCTFNNNHLSSKNDTASPVRDLSPNSMDYQSKNSSISKPSSPEVYWYRKNTLRHEQSGERAWWLNDDPTNVPEGVDVIPVSPNLSQNSQSIEKCKDEQEVEQTHNRFSRLRHIDSGEPPWWLDNSSNVPEGVEKISLSDSNSDDSSESSNKFDCVTLPYPKQQQYQEIDTVDRGITRLASFPLLDETLGDRTSPEGLENPPNAFIEGRTSPYDNVESSVSSNTHSGEFIKRKRPSKAHLYIGDQTNIDDLLEDLIEFDHTCREIETSHSDRSERMSLLDSGTDTYNNLNKHANIDATLINRGYIPLDDTALQLYKDGDYGAYLDLEASISEQQEEFEGFQTNRKNSIVLRTQLSVRVHTIIEKLLNSEGRELRRALFSLKQIFQEDKDLVHEFVQNDGLACLIKVGSEADQNYQNYILRALGQVMLYVDGMNGVMEHGQTVQWLYSLIASRFRLVVKTALKLLLVFVEYVETNSLLLVRAIRSIDTSRGMIPWTNVMRLLKDYDAADTELLIYTMSLVNKCLNGIPDQDTYYDQVDCLEEQGIQIIIQNYMGKQGTDLDLLRQFHIYEAVLHHEDSNERDLFSVNSPIRTLDDNIRKTLRNRKSLVDSQERRKSRRHSTGTSPHGSSQLPRHSMPNSRQQLEHRNMLNKTDRRGHGREEEEEEEDEDDEDDDAESSSSQSSQSLNAPLNNINGSYSDKSSMDVGVTPALRRRRERAERQRSFIREQQEASANIRASFGQPACDQNQSSNRVRYTNGSSPYEAFANGNGATNGHDSNRLTRASSRKDLKPLLNAASKMEPEVKHQTPPQAQAWYAKSPDDSVQAAQDNHADEDEDRRVMLQLKRENTVKDLTQKLAAQHLISANAPPAEEKVARIGDMSGLVSKAKEGLAKSKSKAELVKSPTNETAPKLLSNLPEVKKSENELHWEELVKKMQRPLSLCDLDFTDLNSDDELDVLGPVSISNGVPPPPPPMAPPPNGNGPAINRVPPPPPPGVYRFPPPLPSPVPPPLFGVNLKPAAVPAFRSSPAEPPKVPSAPVYQQPSTQSNKKSKKTVKLFWKEVRDDPIILSRLDDHKMIWDELSPVPVDTQKLEHLFESRAKDLITKKQQELNKNKEVIVLDHKRSNAINIGMTKLPPPRSIKTAILKMDATIMNREGIEKLLTMLPTEEERSRIQEAQAANPDLPLGSAEQFLLTLASISELPARLKLWAFKLDFENSEKEVADPLMDLKQGMETLRANKTFRGILSTLLSIGIFLNGNEVKGFQMEYLAKVPEVKDTVHKHSLLHHLCHMVMEKFPGSTDLYSEIGAVTRASKVDFDELAMNINKLENECKASWDHLKLIAKHDGSTMMKVKMSDFLTDCAERIIVLSIVHRRIINRFHKFILWLGIPLHRVQDTKPNEFCRVVSEFALEYRTTRERVLQQLEKKANHRERNKTRGKMITEVGKFRTKEQCADAELRQLLGSDISDVESIHGTLPWRRQRKDGRMSLGPLLKDERINGNLTDGDDELLETLVKTATKTPATRTTPRERKRTRHADRKSLRRTLKNGLSEEEKKHIAAYIKGY